MSANLAEPFGPSCCEGGICNGHDHSAQPCGCDKGAHYICERHTSTEVFSPDLPAVSGFRVKDSGERTQFQSGMVRDVTTNKTDYSLALDGPMFKRLAEHLTKGAVKYAKRNWMKAAGQEELDRFRESALRHFLQWFNGETDEDHAAAVFFNINGVEYVRNKLEGK